MKKSPLRVAIAFCMMAFSVSFLAFAMSENGAANRDFIAYWVTGQQLVHGANPYDTAAELLMERPLGFQGDSPNYMRNPPIAFFLVLPLGFVSARIGNIFWLLVQLASLVASIRMLWSLQGRPANRLHLLGYLFAPVLACVFAGQLGIFLLLGFTLFLFYYESRPILAGSAMLLCTLKPHLFLPFGIVLLIWILSRKAYRVLVGFLAALLASCTLSFCVDSHAWTQYARMMRNAGIQDIFIPCLSEVFRILVDRDVVWLQTIPEVAGCAWAVWYFWTRRAQWNWLDQGLLLLIVSVACSPYAWFTDEAVLLPAVLIAAYRADQAGRSLLFFGLINGAALIEVLVGVPITTIFYLWTVPAWLAWYLYATRRKATPAAETDNSAVTL